MTNEQKESQLQNGAEIGEVTSETREVPPAIAKDQSSYLAGCGTSVVGLILLIVIAIVISNIPVASGFLTMAFPVFGVATLVVWIVFIVRSFASGKKRYALGLLTVGAVAFLLVAACFGVLLNLNM